MLNPYDSHLKGHLGLKVGMSLDKLADALCFEVSKDIQKKKDQVNANHTLVDASQGALAPALNTERYLTISCSHMAAFCKSVFSGKCCTKLEDLQKALGGPLTLDALMAIYPDSVFQTMVKEGWCWKVVSSEVEEQLDWLPAFLQGALNSSQQISSMPTEMEQAMSLAWWYGKTQSLDAAIAQTNACMPMKSLYLNTIADWVCKYGGGDQFPLVKVVESISRQFNKSLQLGQDYMEQVVGLDLKSNAFSFAFFRAGLIVCQLTSPAGFQKDGFGRLLTRSDLEKVKTKSNTAQAELAESLMSNAFQLLQKSALDWDKQSLLLGAMMTRLVLFIVGKTGKGRDKKKWESLDEINNAFASDLATMQACGTLLAASSGASSSAGSKQGGGIPTKPVALQEQSELCWFWLEYK